MTELTELPEISEANMPVIATKEGLKPYLDAAKAHAIEAAREVNDASTGNGRKAIGSLAAKVSSSKTAIEKPGAEYVKVLKQKGVDAQKLIKEFIVEMDAIRDEIKKPADEWKAAEKARIEALHARIDSISSLSSRACSDTGTVYSSIELKEKREIISAMTFDCDEFGDLHEQAMDTWNQSLEFLDTAIKERTEFELALAESEKLKADMEELKVQQRIKDAAADATAKAKLDAASEIAAANLNAEQAAQQAADELKAEKEEADRLLSEKRDFEAAKAANVEHQREVNNKTMNELMQCCEGLTDKQAKTLITNFVNKKFTHITINY